MPTEARPVQNRLLLAAIAVGVWAVLPPFLGPELNTAMRVEIADHPVPAVVVLLTAAFMAARRDLGGEAWFRAGLIVVLAGAWMTASHVPLWLQVTRDQAPVVATIHHSLPGLAMIGLGSAWSYICR